MVKKNTQTKILLLTVPLCSQVMVILNKCLLQLKIRSKNKKRVYQEQAKDTRSTNSLIKLKVCVYLSSSIYQLHSHNFITLIYMHHESLLRAELPSKVLKACTLAKYVLKTDVNIFS